MEMFTFGKTIRELVTSWANQRQRTFLSLIGLTQISPFGGRLGNYAIYCSDAFATGLLRLPQELSQPH